MREKMMNFNNKTELRKYLPGDLLPKVTILLQDSGYVTLPGDLLPKVTILLQDSGYVTISPIELTRYDWRRFNEKVKRMGGLWIFDGGHAHWSIPWTQ